MKENDKDWGSPGFLDVYVGLVVANIATPDESVLTWLKANGFADLARCPGCHLDDFRHEQDCPAFKKIEAAVHQWWQAAAALIAAHHG